MKDICIIIPCYNEAQGFDRTAFETYYTLLPDTHFIFVNDGSTDATGALLDDIASANLPAVSGKNTTRQAGANTYALHLDQNVGKGEAVRQGIRFALAETEASYIGYFDADFAAPLTEVNHLYEQFVSHPDCLIVLGSRQKKEGTVIKRYGYRHYPGRVFAAVVNLFMLKHHIYDTQCGAKLLHRSCAEWIAERPFKTRWLFDLEILLRLQSRYTSATFHTYIKEVPLRHWTDRGASKIRSIDVCLIPFQLIKLWWIFRKNKNNRV